MTSVKCLECGNQYSEEKRRGSCNLCSSEKRLNAAKFFNIVPELMDRDELRQHLEILTSDDEVSYDELAKGPADPTTNIAVNASE